ncbi:MAG TPA: P-loop NTPase fold protein, partial [Methylococcaceae bacterium]|nr:P-loop NTPase fold protein [Methylococcaceae bacterium]
MAEIPRFNLLSDDPTEQDQLGRGYLVEELGRRIRHCPTPLVIGVHGDWGTGKTSFLMQLRRYLDDDSQKVPAVTVWFDAWRYQHEPVPVVALLAAIRDQFGALARTKKWLQKMGDVTVRSLLAMMTDIGKFIQFEVMPDAAKIQGFGEQWEKRNLADRLQTDTVQDILKGAVATLLKGVDGKAITRRVVVFIDDLDRCEPEAAYRLLEGVKVYLRLDHCVFVLGMNQRAVEDAIATRLPKSLDKQQGVTRIRAAAYLEKICQNVWRLPAILILKDQPRINCWTKPRRFRITAWEAHKQPSGDIGLSVS